MFATELLSKEEIRRFSVRSNWSALRMVLGNWFIIAGVFAVVAFWTNPVTIFLAILVFGGRQLSLDVLVHDCGHSSMFTRWKWNRFVAEWLAAPFVFSHAKSYRLKHGKHHRLGGTANDPDLQNYINYAVARKSLMRKVARDLTGITGIKILRLSVKALGPAVLVYWVLANLFLFGILYSTGNGILYWLWPAAWLTSHMLVLRIRQAAEHAAVPDLFDPDPRKHTRTTYARWWERLLLAPNFVNYHLEHHILPTVPCYRLREFHDYLMAKGHLEDAKFCDGYWNVVKQLVLPPGIVKEQSTMPT